MKKMFVFLFSILSVAFGFSQRVGIGTINPDASAKLDISSDNAGVLVPRMTTTDRNRIANPAKGLLVFDSTTNNFWFHNGSAWSQMQNNNNVRFGFDLQQNFTLSTAYNIPFVNNYNLDPLAVTLTNATTVTIARQGLYHFGLLGLKHNENAASATATSGIFNLSVTVNGKQYQIIVNGVQVGFSSSWSFGTTTLSFDLFVPANSAITINAATSFNSGFIKSDSGHFFGYLISD